MTEFATIELTLIASSLTNPRKHFNPAKLAELAESIKTSGVHQPILVRPLPGSRVADTDRKVEFELVCGERRLRASQQAGVHTIPAMIRGLTDEQVLEIQIVENLQRDDLTELEEAEGYEQLMQHASITADQVGAKIGKSRSYVYGRLKLLDLSMECKQALREGKIDASRALLIARIPDSKLQLKALKFSTDPTGYPAEPPSVRKVQDWLKANVMLRLEGAIFKLTDVRLVEAAGSCTDCPKRTGANPDLFADVDGADICTDPECFHGKEEAHRAQLVKKAESRGLRIVQDKEALELLNGNTYRTTPLGYTALSNQRIDLSKEGERPITLGQALGKDAPSPILFIHPKTQEVSELVPEDEAEAVLLAKGLIQAVEQREEQRDDLDKELQRLQERAKRDTERAVQNAMDDAVTTAIHQSTTAQAKTLLTGDVLRAFLLCELDDYDGPEAVARYANYEFADGVDEMDAITMHLQRMGDTDLLRTTAHFLLGRAGFTSDEPNNPVTTALAKLLDVDGKAVAKSAQAKVKGEYADRIKEVQAKIDAQKPDLPQPPLAQPKNAVGKDSKGSKGKSKTPAAPASKLSEGEALSGIAAAMQGLEGSASAPEGAVAPPDVPATGFDVGQKVKVVTDLDKLGVLVKRHAGKAGTITKKEPGSNHWHVMVRAGGLQLFAEDQIERVAA